jgi:hypothetical protein
MMLIAILLCLISLAQDSLDYLVLGRDVPLEVLGYKVDVHIDKLDLDTEAGIPAWFSSSVLLLCSVLLATITSAYKRTDHRYVYHWCALCIIFALLSLDETISIHERFIEPLRFLWGTGGLFYFAWVIPGGAFAGLLTLAYYRFVFDLPAKSRRLFIAAGALYLSGALGFEMLGGLWADHYGELNWIYRVLVTAEEFLEMSGAILFLFALMRYSVSLEVSAGGMASKANTALAKNIEPSQKPSMSG